MPPLPCRRRADATLVRGLIALLALLSAAPTRAEEVARYNDPPPTAKRSPLALRIIELARRIAKANRRPIPAPDARLDAAVQALLPFIPTGAPPPNELVEAALRLHGLIEPSPHLVVVSATEGAEEALLAELSGRLREVLAEGRHRRIGVALGPAGRGQIRLLIAFQESFVSLRPVPRELPAGGRATLDGRAEPPYQRPALFVTRPDGSVQKFRPPESTGRFNGVFVCGESGRYQVEVTAEDRLGPSVLANFPVWCGVAAPRTLVASVSTDPPWDPGGSREAAEAQLLLLLNHDRAAAQLPPLTPDRGLCDVARAHSIDMRDHDFVGHVSPTSGAADERLRRAGQYVNIVLENVGRAYSPAEVERGFMDSPGHRGNVLSREVDRIGLGVAVGRGEASRGGGRELFVTQLFARFPSTFDPRRAPTELRARLDQLRREANVPPLAADADLDTVAEETARGLADETLPKERSGLPAERAAPRFADRYRSLRTVVIQAQEIAQLRGSPALVDLRASHAGVAVVPGRKDTSGRDLYIALVLGVPR